MVKQSPSRNNRSKGVRVKHVLQICVLLAICFWLIYQVKHSHDKKREFDEDDARMSVKTHVSDEVFKFGRKDLQPLLNEGTLKNGKVDEELEEEETVAEEGNKNEEEEQEEDSKNEEKEDEAKGGDDEGDEGDEEKSETEVELEDFFVDGEKEREEVDEKEAEEMDSEDIEGDRKRNMSSLQEQERDGGSSRNTHEAREENYRADDASSAVTHETEPETGMDHSNENTETKVVEEVSEKSNTTTGVKPEKGDTGENSANVTVKEDRGSETGLDKLEGTSLLNSTVTAESSNLLEVSNNSTDGSLLQNGTEMKPDVTEAQNATLALGKENDSNTASNYDQSNSNLVVSGNTGNADAAVTGEFPNSSTTTASETALSEKVITSNSSVEVEGHSGLSTTEENADTTRNEKSETSSGTNKSRDSSESGNADAVQRDPIDSTDSSVALDEKDVRSGGTLQEIRAEGTENGDAAAQ
ncbi:hypothetical protein RHSIM_Rhsim11G0148900 [Rhododendron simsii]|uniref:Uncharacterized protein n=1 Tax=Rhododendron simsii TaxID=118357 RepID=A0A834G745_RHOSS|nr:hypothetical protein RHSIM_Rhsim11G0148900 [Rhododendron simsii]